MQKLSCVVDKDLNNLIIILLFCILVVERKFRKDYYCLYGDIVSEENVTEFESQLKEKDQKLDNQSSELNYLTNEIIPNLKKENAELKKIKNELTEALENTTRKYYDQLDINADLSEKLTKIGAEEAINKVRAEKLESEIDDIKKDAEAKVADFKAKLDDVDADKVDKIKAENQDLHSKCSLAIHYHTFQLTDESREQPELDLKVAMKNTSKLMTPFYCIREGRRLVV